MEMLPPKETPEMYEEQFERATADVSAYLWAIEAWPEESENLGSDYLLLKALSHRARGRLALTVITSANHKEYLSYKNKLQKLWDQAEILLSHKVREHRALMEHQITHQFGARLAGLRDSLERLRRFHEDGLLTGDPDWLQNEMREEAHDFLLQFQDMHHVGEELEHEPLRDNLSPQVRSSFRQQFDSLEEDFGRLFFCFQSVADLLPVMQREEYGQARWWFYPPPAAPQELDEQEAEMEALVERLGEVYRSQAELTPVDCSYSDLAISYAAGELSFQERGEMRRHLLTCRHCLDLILDLRQAELTTAAEADRPVELLPRLREALQPVATEGWRTVAALLEDLRGVFLGLFNAPPPRPALAWASTPQEVIIKPGQRISARDSLRLRFQSDRDAFVILLWQGSTGEVRSLSSGTIAAGEMQELSLSGAILWRRTGAEGRDTFYLMRFSGPPHNWERRLPAQPVRDAADLKAAFPEADISFLQVVHERHDGD